MSTSAARGVREGAADVLIADRMNHVVDGDSKNGGVRGKRTDHDGDNEEDALHAAILCRFQITSETTFTSSSTDLQCPSFVKTGTRWGASHSCCIASYRPRLLAS